MLVVEFDKTARAVLAARRLRTAPFALVLVAGAWLAGCSASVDQGFGPKLPDSPAALGPGVGDKPPETSYLASAAETLTAPATPGNSAYKIGPQDVLDVSVFKVPELSRTVQVADSGSVNLPLVGDVPAAGMTAQDVERDLSTKLGAKYLQKPQVTVFVKEHNSQRVTIDGAVKKPGVYPIRGKTTLLQFIAMAEGLDDSSDSSNIVVFRREEAKRMAARFDIGSIRSGAAEDPEIKPGDVIVANGSQVKSVFNSIAKALPVAGFFLPFL